MQFFPEDISALILKYLKKLQMIILEKGEKKEEKKMKKRRR